jgi:heme-degrading monooxygenase HmoA
MFVRATTTYIREGMIDKLIEIYWNSIIPAAKKQKGYRGAQMLVNRETCKGISLTFWDSEEDENATGKSQYYRDQLLKVYVLLSADPIREGYEVEFDEEGLIPFQDSE